MFSPTRAHQPLTKVQIFFDGGCIPNPGQKYGSFEVTVQGITAVKRYRVEFGHGTNNEAEFNSLEMALCETLGYLREHRIQPKDCEVEIFTDSKIVYHRLMGKNRIHKKKSWAEASERMFRLACQALNMTDQFGKFRMTWKKRETNVERFGH